MNVMRTIETDRHTDDEVKIIIGWLSHAVRALHVNKCECVCALIEYQLKSDFSVHVLSSSR